MKALIAMSGGVDSSVAALLTQQAGYSCIGCTMKLYEDPIERRERTGRTCCALEDVEDARQVAYRLGIPYYVFNYQDAFYQQVIAKFIRCYQCGRTPNPCIDCNRFLKFGELLHRARVLGCDKLVTGHYARIEETPDGFVLKKARDRSKDQSYVLYGMTQEQLAHTLFPLGELCKTEARTLAEVWGFQTAHKPDSQDICFVPDGDYAEVIRQYTGSTSAAGEFRLTDGTVIGQHRGITRYTIGQRKGLGIAYKEPLYVCRIDRAENVVWLGSRDEVFGRTAVVREMHWILKTPPMPFRCAAKIRYGQQEQPVSVSHLDGDRVLLVFDGPQWAITPGQIAVLYEGEIVLGGGEIEGAGVASDPHYPA